MTRNLFFTSLGIFIGVWIIWPGVTTTKGWKCAKDIALNSDKVSSDSQDPLQSIRRKLKVTSALSPKTLLRSENLGKMDKVRILGDACFRF